MTNSTPLLQVTGLKRGFGSGSTRVEVLKELELEMKRGELVALMGPSGCGKTTLLNIIGGLLEADHGLIILNNETYGKTHPKQLAKLRQATVGWIFQDFHLFDHMTALDNVIAALELSGMPEDEAIISATKAMERVDLTDKMESRADELSGGQQQRVAVARAISGKRDLLLADEPTGNLDRASGNAIIKLFTDLTRDPVDPISILMVTHDPIIAKQADRMMMLKDGRVVHSTVEESWGKKKTEGGGP